MRSFKTSTLLALLGLFVVMETASAGILPFSGRRWECRKQQIREEVIEDLSAKMDKDLAREVKRISMALEKKAMAQIAVESKRLDARVHAETVKLQKQAIAQIAAEAKKLNQAVKAESEKLNKLVQAEMEKMRQLADSQMQQTIAKLPQEVLLQVQNEADKLKDTIMPEIKAAMKAEIEALEQKLKEESNKEDSEETPQEKAIEPKVVKPEEEKETADEE